MSSRILAIDFDGTIVEDNYPHIGTIKQGAKENINKLYDDGYTIIIWTCRTGKALKEAKQWLQLHGIKHHHVNKSCPYNVQEYKVDTRKVYADMYIDDKMMFKLPPWPEIYLKIIETIPTYAEKVGREGFL